MASSESNTPQFKHTRPSSLRRQRTATMKRCAVTTIAAALTGLAFPADAAISNLRGGGIASYLPADRLQEQKNQSNQPNQPNQQYRHPPQHAQQTPNRPMMHQMHLPRELMERREMAMEDDPTRGSRRRKPSDNDISNNSDNGNNARGNGGKDLEEMERENERRKKKNKEKKDKDKKQNGNDKGDKDKGKKQNGKDKGDKDQDKKQNGKNQNAKDEDEDKLSKKEQKELMKQQNQQQSAKPVSVEDEKLSKKEQKELMKQQNQQQSSKPEKPNANSEEIDFKDLSKQEKKELLKQQKEQTDGKLNVQSDVVGNSASTSSNNSQPKPGSKPGKEQDTSGGQAGGFVGIKPIGVEEDDAPASYPTMRPTSRPTKKPKGQPAVSQQDGLLSFGNKDEMIMESVATDQATFEPFFLTSLPDISTQIDGFENNNGLNYVHTGLGWSGDNSLKYEGSNSIVSGIQPNFMDLTDQHTQAAKYSNLTLITDDDFEGGVLSFQLMLDMQIPNDAFYVVVDDVVALEPPIHRELISKGDSFSQGVVGEWMEYSVAVGQGKHNVTWVHVYNPFGMESLPPRSGQPELRMDDLRFTPFTGTAAQGFEGDGGASFLNPGEVELEVATDGDADWETDSLTSVHSEGSYSIVASTSDINKKSGSADVHFAIYSEEGGLLKYRVKTSTTAPHDDFAVLLNDARMEAIFGMDTMFEERTLDIPPGKQVVTFSHRKNPGELSSNLLDSLGAVETEGKTWVDDVRFTPL